MQDELVHDRKKKGAYCCCGEKGKRHDGCFLFLASLLLVAVLVLGLML